LPLIFNPTLGYAVRKVKENKMELKLYATHQLLAYADDVNVLGDTIDSVKENIPFYRC
jgi:hypothetical protein